MAILAPDKLVKKIGEIKAARTPWEDHWRDLAFYFQPNRREIHEMPAKGNRRHNNLLDNTGVQSVELLAAGLHSMLTNPNVEWFELTTGNDAVDNSDDIREWLQASTLIMFNTLNGSNFNTEIHQLYLDLNTFGTSAMMIEEDPVNVVRFSNKHIKDVFVEENHLGLVDRIYVEFEWSAENLVAEFGEDKVSKKVRDCYQKNEFDKKFKFVHAVYPKDTFSGAKDSLFPFVSQYVEVEEKHLLREGGYREFPFVVPRWSKTAMETYGRSPAMVALPDMKTLNVMTETMLIAGQKVADPPLQANDDGVVMPIITRPGGITYRRQGTDPITPLFSNIPIDFGFQAIEDRRQRIRSSFFVDQLQMQNTGPQMTATEVLQRTEEKNRLLGPVLGRMQSEFLRPLVDRLFGIMFRRGMLPEAPQQLEGTTVSVKYSSMIARAQKVSAAQNVLRTVEAVAPFINLDPSVADMFNGDEVVRSMARAFNFPQSAIRPQKEIEAIREGRAQAQQQALEAEQQQREADQFSKVGPAAAQLQQAEQGG
jgi:hypothetical protein